MNIQEVAPPTKKHERMVKHIKKSYKKDGKLTDDEKSIAYATAWKNYNKEEVVLEKDLNPSIELAKIKLEKKKKEDAKKKKAKALAKSKQRATGALKKHDSDGDGYVRVIDAGYELEGEDLQEKDLNAAERRALPDSDFIFPGKGEGPKGKQRGAYPIPDKKHARNALAMAAAHASPEKEAKVKAAVKKKFPDIEQSEDWKPEIEVIDTKKEAKKREKKRKEAESSLPPHLRLDAMKKAFAHTNESAVLDANTKIKKNEKREKDKKELMKLIQRYRHMKDMENPAKALSGRSQKESFEIDKSAHKKVQKKAKLRNLAKGNMNPNEKAAAEKKAGGPKLAFEGWQDRAKEAMRKVAGKKPPKKHDYGRDAGKVARELMRKKDHQTVNFLDPDD